MSDNDVVQLAREAGLLPAGSVLKHRSTLVGDLAHFAHLIEERLRFDSIHSCSNDCQRPACAAVRKAVAAERERILAILDELQANCEHHTFYGYAANVIRESSK